MAVLNYYTTDGTAMPGNWANYVTPPGCTCGTCGLLVRWGESHSCPQRTVLPLCSHCYANHYYGFPCVKRTKSNPVPAPESAGGEEPVSLIDERQVEVLDGFRNARDIAARHAQSKVDRATLMKIQAEAYIAEARELIAELNENLPMPNETGANIGPIPGAGGATR